MSLVKYNSFAILLMYLGILPFCLSNFFFFFDPTLQIFGQSIIKLLQLYGIVIAAFMLGSYWGISTSKPSHTSRIVLILSNIMALILWVLSALNPESCLAYLSFFFLLIVGVDFLLSRSKLISQFYFKNRVYVSIIVFGLLRLMLWQVKV